MVLSSGSANIVERDSKIASISKNCPEFELKLQVSIGPRNVRMRNASGHSWFIRWGVSSVLNFLPTFATNWLMSPRKTSVFNKWPGVAQCSPITAAEVRSYSQCQGRGLGQGKYSVETKRRQNVFSGYHGDTQPISCSSIMAQTRPGEYFQWALWGVLWHTSRLSVNISTVTKV